MIDDIICGFSAILAIESHIELAGKPEGKPAIRIIEVSGRYSEIIADSGDARDTEFQKFHFYISEVCMDSVNGDSRFFCKCSNTLFYDFSSTFEIVIIEIKPDEDISFMEFLNNSHSMSTKSEGAVNHDISLCSANIEAIDVLMEEYGDMSKTFFVQIVKK